MEYPNEMMPFIIQDIKRNYNVSLNIQAAPYIPHDMILEMQKKYILFFLIYKSIEWILKYKMLQWRINENTFIYNNINFFHFSKCS